MMYGTDVPVTTLRTEAVCLTGSILEQVRILKHIRGSLQYDAAERSLQLTLLGMEEVKLPLLGYVWSPATQQYRSCYWLIVVMEDGTLRRIHVPADTRSHLDAPPDMEGLPQIFVIDVESCCGVKKGEPHKRGCLWANPQEGKLCDAPPHFDGLPTASEFREARGDES